MPVRAIRHSHGAGGEVVHRDRVHEAGPATEPFRATVRVGGGNGEGAARRDRHGAGEIDHTRERNVATYHIVSEDMQESSTWLKQNMQTLLDG
ncbi:hypothetical protein, partial [Micromonospora gifhornensis]|uniref:hypothetical protein n=1 Tax=Micromonospora gifhornensis TaxID=84594 RepID=UPI003654D00B